MLEFIQLICHLELILCSFVPIRPRIAIFGETYFVELSSGMLKRQTAVMQMI